MTVRAFSQYAELWQEQIEPEELAELQGMAKNIERTAKRKWLFDLFLGGLALGLTCVVVWKYSTSPPVKLGFALLGAVVLWAGWTRHRITRAWRATAIDDPRVFFEKTIKTARAEIRFSTISLYLMLPAFFSIVLLRAVDHGFESIAMALHEMLKVNFGITMAATAAFALAALYFVRDNIKLRGQLRRLEGMRREWDEQEARDLGEGP